MVLSDILVLGCCVLFFWGTWKQAPLNYTQCRAGHRHQHALGVRRRDFHLHRHRRDGRGALIRALTGRLGPRELDIFAGEFSDEDAAHSIKGRLE